MKKLLTITLLVFASTSVVHAQQSDSWSSSDGPGHYEGNFKGLSGDAKYKIIPLKRDDKFVRYVINRDKGELILLIQSGAKTILEKKIDKNLVDSLDVSKFSQPIIVHIKGVKAAGNFTIDYPVKSS